MLIFSVDLLVAGQVARASHSEPYLCFRLDLDSHRVAELALKVYPHGLPSVQVGCAVYVCQANASLVNAATRLLELMAPTEDTELLAQ